MAASKKPSAGPCPPSDTRYSRGESDNSGSSTEIDSDKEIAASNFGNEGKEKAVPDAFQYPLRTSEAKKTVNARRLPLKKPEATQFIYPTTSSMGKLLRGLLEVLGRHMVLVGLEMAS